MGQTPSPEVTLPGASGFLEMDSPVDTVSPAILEIEDWGLSSQARRIVTETPSISGSPMLEPPKPELLSPEPASVSTELASAAAAALELSSLEQEATSVINRLLPGWIDRMRAELVEELKRRR